MTRPLGILTLMIAAAIVCQNSQLADALIYNRDAIASGELWRLLTCQFVHYSTSHLFWNLVVVAIPAYLIVAMGREFLWTVSASLLVIGPLLFIADDALLYYAGLSGIGSALIMQLACLKLREPTSPRFFWCLVMGVMVAKLASELVFSQPLLSGGPESQFVPVPLAHLIGLIIGCIASRAQLPTGKTSTTPSPRQNEVFDLPRALERVTR